MAVAAGLVAAGALRIGRVAGEVKEAAAEKPALELQGPAVAQAHRKQADAAKAGYQTTQADYDLGMARALPASHRIHDQCADHADP